MIALAAAALVAAPLQGAPATASPSALVEGQRPHAALAPDGYAFQLHLPPGAAARKPASRYPLMIFLHGSGERGGDLARVTAHGPPKRAAAYSDFPFLLVSPHLPADQDWDLDKLRLILAWALKSLPADPDRVILTGLSRGGHATWRWGAAEPWRFAALVPVAGRGDPATACALKDKPVWAFHGDRDDVVTPEGSFAMARAIRACGGQPRLTIYPDLGHNSWDPAYDDPALYYWLLARRRPPQDKDRP